MVGIVDIKHFLMRLVHNSPRKNYVFFLMKMIITQILAFSFVRIIIGFVGGLKLQVVHTLASFWSNGGFPIRDNRKL